MTRRRVEHSANHDLAVLLVALAVLALIYAAGRAIAIDEPTYTPAPQQPGQGTPAPGGRVPDPSRGAARDTSGASWLSGEVIPRRVAGHHRQELPA